MVEGRLVWVTGRATGKWCDQRARVDRVEGSKVYVTLLGTDEKAVIFPGDLCGLQLTEEVQIRFGVHRTIRQTLIDWTKIDRRKE